MMKLKSNWTLLLAFSLFLGACAKEEMTPPDDLPVEEQKCNAYILAYAPSTKVAVSDNYTKLSWTKEDTLSVYTNKGRFVDFVYDSSEGDGVVRFKGSLEDGEKTEGYAVYPSGNHAVSEGELYVSLPEEYVYRSGEARPVMKADLDSETGILTFNHVGGVMAFDVKGVPAGASSFSFKTSKKISGLFQVQDDEISVVEQDQESTVIFNFTPLSMVEDMKFFVPVPTGEYSGFTISVNAGDETVATKTANSTNSIERTSLKKFIFAASDIVYVTVEGSGNKSGDSWENAKTLSAALANAKDEQVIRVAGGIYTPDTILEGSTDQAAERNTFLVKKNVTIQGSYKTGTSVVDTVATPTVISGALQDGKKAYHTMVVASASEGSVSLKGLTFTDGTPMLVNTSALVESAPTTTTKDGFGIMDYRGGGLYVASATQISSCLFRDNESAFHTNTSGTMGIGMYVASKVNVTVENTTFRNNNGGSCGGAVYSHGTSTFKNSLFDGNSSSHSGAVHNGGTITIDECVFKENAAIKGFAGAFRHQGSRATLTNSSFVRNTSTNHGGAIQNNRNQMTITNCAFEGNTSDADGGAIANWGGGTMTVTLSSFVANSAVNGGSITNMLNASSDSPSSLTMSKCIFVGNEQSEDNDATDGGAVVNHGSKATISGCSFSKFIADQGGAVANMPYKDLVAEIKLDKGCEFIDNKARLGGAFANIDATAEVANSDFDRNVASGYAGAIYNGFDSAPAVLTVKASSFNGNTSEGNGGAIMNWYADTVSDLATPSVSISNSTFDGNKVVSKNAYTSQGGAIANQCGILTVAGSQFKDNFAAHAGAIYSYDCSANTTTKISNKVAYTYVYNTLFDSNKADLTANANAQGSDIRSHGASKNVVVNSTFRGGNAPTGSVRLRTGATCYLVSCTFTENASGPYNQSSVMKVYNTVSFANTKVKYNYYANNKDGTNYLQSSFIGTMYINGGRGKDNTNSLYDAQGKAADYSLASTVFGTFKDGVYPVVSEPALSKGMTNADLSALANEIKVQMPDLETKYFIWDQKGSPREENEKVMGAYIGDVYLDPNRYGYLNNTELVEEYNLRGLITDQDGKPIKGVAVSDGYDVVTTDANGVYQFAAHQDARLLSVSVPAEYEIPYKNNRPDFWVPIDPTEYEIRTDFTFNKRASSADNFTIFSLADTHVKTAAHYERFSTETMADLENMVNYGNYNENSFAVILGDIVFDSYEQVENVKTSLVNSPVPVFPCFGNHDCSSSVGESELDLISKYQQHFGPVDYSFNIGKAHVVFMKDMIYEGKSPNGTEGHNYAQGILDHQLEWLKKDLAAVEDKENKLIIMCVHIPLRGTGNGSRNYRAVVNEMLKFKEAHVLSGHHHGVYNHIPSSDVTVGGKNFYDHNQVAAAGSWWSSNLNPDGSPNGYMVYNINGNTVADYAYKGTNQDAGYQMRVYDGGVTYSAPFPWLNYNNWTQKFLWSSLGMDLTGKFVVHVFNGDTRDWVVNFVQNGVSAPMTRTTSAWYDVASYAFAAYYTNWTGGGKERYSTKVENTNFWYIDAPSGKPAQEKDWYIEAIHTVNGKSVRYTASELHDNFTGFPY